MAAPHFSNHSSGDPTNLSQLRDRVNSAMHSVSNYLNEKSLRMGPKKLRHLLILVVACWGGACLVIILDSLLSQQTTYHREKQAYPQHIPGEHSGDSNLSRNRGHSAPFQCYLDSLREHDPDRYLRMLTTSPWQIDSLHRDEGNLSRLNH